MYSNLTNEVQSGSQGQSMICDIPIVETCMTRTNSEAIKRGSLSIGPHMVLRQSSVRGVLLALNNQLGRSMAKKKWAFDNVTTINKT
jgi:hypothetical protein